MSNPSENTEPQKTKSLLDVDPNEIKGIARIQDNPEETEDSTAQLKVNAAKEATESYKSKDSSEPNNQKPSS